MPLISDPPPTEKTPPNIWFHPHNQQKNKNDTPLPGRLKWNSPNHKVPVYDHIKIATKSCCLFNCTLNLLNRMYDFTKIDLETIVLFCTGSF